MMIPRSTLFAYAANLYGSQLACLNVMSALCLLYGGDRQGTLGSQLWYETLTDLEGVHKTIFSHTAIYIKTEVTISLHRLALR